MSERARTGFVERGFAETAILAGILLWWFTAQGVPEFVLPSPGAVALTMARFFTDASLAYHFAISAGRVIAAVTCAMLLSLILAALASRSAIVTAILERRVLVFLNSFPSVGWAILGVMWFQVSTGTVIFIQMAIILPFCLISAMSGFRQIDAELAEMGRSLSRNPVRHFLKVTLPLMTPILMSGIRIAYGICWKIALVAELFGAQSGLGYLLVRAQSSADATMVFAVCLMIVVAVIVVDRLILNPLAQRYSVNKGASQ